LQEPSVLPARLPNLLVNGASGIAVGMATSVPPHNLGEVCDALIYLLDHWEERDEVTVEDLMRFLPGPDFPTGGVILGSEELTRAYATGRGQIAVRAQAHIEEMSGGRYRIVITELPYQVNKSGLLERIAELVREGRLEDISDLRDESDRRGMSIVIELRRGAQPKKVLNRLFKYTPLQSTFSIQLLALVDGEPRLLPLKRLMELYVEHRREVIVRRSRYELKRAQDRAHILEGLKIALQFLDAVIQTIRQSPDAETARGRLMERFGLTEVQAQAILDMPLRRLAALERKKIDDEYEDLIRRIAYLEDLLASPRKVLGVIRTDLEELKKTYGDPRRTHIVHGVEAEFEEEDLVPEEAVLIVLTQRGYVKRMPERVFRAQDRGGRGVIGIQTKEEDSVLYLLSAHSLDTVLFFTNRGKVYAERVYQIPAADRTAQGVLLAGMLSLEADERVTAAVAIREGANGSSFLTMVTTGGRVKRTPLEEFASLRTGGLVALLLEEGDELGWVRLTPGDAELILVTEGGQALRFREDEVRPMKRMAAGVGGIRLEEGDRVASADVVVPDADLFIVTEQGYGKRVPLAEFPTQGRYGKGVVCIGGKPQNRGVVAAARVVGPGDEVTLISARGVVLRVPASTIPQMGRPARGVRLMDLKDGDRVASVAVIRQE
ncbi:MAG: DNA gyrase subunit A, partial [Anaerolineae bacterium]|nr:DNA gyrase subunit A [Anaerolineae bacterium]MCX8068519.1 DNA gyrase subunit A [Anaerolineae bacterium]